MKALIAQMIRTSSLPVITPGGEAASPAQPHVTQVRAGEASNFLP